MRPKAINVKVLNNYNIEITFDNNEKKIFDMKKIIQPNTVFECLSDWEIFSKVYLDENSVVSWNKNPSIDSNIEWSNKIDLCTDSLYVDSINI